MFKIFTKDNGTHHVQANSPEEARGIFHDARVGQVLPTRRAIIKKVKLVKET